MTRKSRDKTMQRASHQNRFESGNGVSLPAVRQRAVLLLGPTGSGKTPLGAMLEDQGLKGQPCVHFDFGYNLRQVVTKSESDEVVSERDIEFLRGVLEHGALLEDRDFPIARRLLASFLRKRDVQAGTIVVMNGLPRHVGQAQALNSSLDVRAVILLQCSPEVVRQRIATNAGGDRTRRTDDDAEAIERKLEIYAQRTAPLVSYFRGRGTAVLEIPVTVGMTCEETWSQVQAGPLAL
ncbi:MAG: nucleoside monophosphate kinase [Pirellulaceae bacterium]